MHTINSIYIKPPIEQIFELACDIQNWPLILPHYQLVRIVEQSPDGRRKESTMCATRQFIGNIGVPVSWSSIQVCEPDTYRICYKHTGGATTGMWVVWSLENDPWDRGVLVTITHDLRYPLSLMNGWFAGQLVGEGFVHFIAGRTLSALKTYAENNS